MVAAVVSAVRVSVVAVQTARIVHVKRRRWRIRVDDLVGVCGRLHRVIHGRMVMVVAGHPVGGHLMVAAG